MGPKAERIGGLVAEYWPDQPWPEDTVEAFGLDLGAEDLPLSILEMALAQRAAAPPPGVVIAMARELIEWALRWERDSNGRYPCDPLALEVLAALRGTTGLRLAGGT